MLNEKMQSQNAMYFMISFCMECLENANLWRPKVVEWLPRVGQRMESEY